MAFKRIPHLRVEVSLDDQWPLPRAELDLRTRPSNTQMPMTLPRPDLADRLGVTYRRIPVLAIGGDVYCDSNLMVSVLERRFPPSAGFGTLFPKRNGGGKADTGLIKALSLSWADRVLGSLGSQMLPYNKFKQDFLDDRSGVRVPLFKLSLHEC